MKISLSEALKVASNWESSSLPVKAALLSPGVSGFRVVVYGTVSVEGSTVCVSPAPRSELRIPLPEEGLVLKSSDELPSDDREALMDRIVSVLSGRLPDGMMFFIYELWAA